mgnify:CR=1 FL=1
MTAISHTLLIRSKTATVRTLDCICSLLNEITFSLLFILLKFILFLIKWRLLSRNISLLWFSLAFVLCSLTLSNCNSYKGFSKILLYLSRNACIYSCWVIYLLGLFYYLLKSGFQPTSDMTRISEALVMWYTFVSYCTECSRSLVSYFRSKMRGPY